MRRVLTVLLAFAFSSGCLVVEREVQSPEPRAEDGRREIDVPVAEPAPLRRSSDGLLVGSLGWALLSADVPRAVIEIDQLGDAELSREAIAALEQSLRDHGRKESVEVVVEEGRATTDVYSLEDVVAASSEHRDRFSGDGAVALHVLVLAGRFEQQGVTGAAFHATALALFPQETRNVLPPGAELRAFEIAVAIHELGHIFGLVNRTGVGEFHEDPDHPGHTADEDSVMYWAVENPSVGEIFRTGPPTEFNDADRREMDMIRKQRP